MTTPPQGRDVVLTRNIRSGDGELLAKGTTYRVVDEIDVTGTPLTGPILVIVHRTTPFIKHVVHGGSVRPV